MADHDRDRIARCLTSGGVALLPTDTVYGLAAAPGRPSAIEAIFEMKDRPAHMNLQVLMPEAADPASIGCVAPAVAAALLADMALRPNVTFILPLDAGRKPEWLSERDEVGVRYPADPRTQAVLSITGPLFATSANAHGQPPGVDCGEIVKSLTRAPDEIWDVGRLGGTASTVVNFNADPPHVLRWGVLTDLSEFGLGHA